MTKALLGGVLVVMLASLVPVFAHHSPAAFDRTKEPAHVDRGQRPR